MQATNQKTEWPLKIQFETAVHHGNGRGMAGLIDRCALRDGKGVPYLAGSALKGKFRYAALRIGLAREETVCEFGDRPECEEEKPCAICDLFGSRTQIGRAQFRDAYPGPEYRLLINGQESEERALFRRDATYRATTAIDRATGGARKGMLFSTEVLPAGIEFVSEIRGPAEYEVLLGEAAHLLTHFGAGGARGLGRCTYLFAKDAR